MYCEGELLTSDLEASLRCAAPQPDSSTAVLGESRDRAPDWEKQNKNL